MRIGEAFGLVALSVAAMWCAAIPLAGHPGLQALMAGAGVSVMAIAIHQISIHS